MCQTGVYFCPQKPTLIAFYVQDNGFDLVYDYEYREFLIFNFRLAQSHLETAKCFDNLVLPYTLTSFWMHLCDENGSYFAPT